ncbi:DUF2461 domain-containing protein [soil metagenome]
MLQQKTLDFLLLLKKNNTREWFEKNRSAFIDAKEDFENFICKLLKNTASFDNDLKDLEVKNCTFRQYRDVRFSKDKSPYKINMGAYFNRGGKKSFYAGFYFHFEPGNKSSVGGGLWMPQAPELKKVRQEIDYCFDEFNNIITDKKFIKTFISLEEGEMKLKKAPKGYEPDNPAIEILKLKSMVALKPVTDKELTEASLLKNTSEVFRILKPVLDFINRALD